MSHSAATDSIVQQFDAQLPAASQAMIQRAAEFGGLVVAPQAANWQVERRHPTETLRAACAAGLAGVELSSELGGAGLSFSTKLRVVEELARYDFGFAFSLVNHHNALTRIAQSASDMAQRLVPRMLTGECIGCSAYTEPGHGSDLAHIVTSAQRVDGGWRLNGRKAWITNAAVASVVIVLAQTDPAAGAKGLGQWIVEADRPGFVREPAYAVHSAQAIGVGGFQLENYTAPDYALLATPGAGFKSALGGINGARAYVAAMCAGMLDASIGHAARYAQQREAFGSKVIDFQGPRWSLVDAETDLAALRLLAYRAARLVDAGQGAEEAAARAKKFAADRTQAHIAGCIQVMGANGLRDDVPLMRHLDACKFACFTDGTTEMMNERLGRFLTSRHSPSTDR